MVVFNMSLNNKKVVKTGFVIILIIILILIAIGIYKIFFRSISKEDACMQISGVQEIPTSRYTSVLKEVHENIDSYIGKKMKFVGFVYRLYDFNDNQFVLAREMIVSADYQAVTVGFMCELNNAKQYKDGCWVEIEGTITKGEYHGEIPIIKVDSIKEVKTPGEEYVYPPENADLQTSALL